MPTTLWYEVSDPFMPGVIVGIKQYEFDGTAVDIPGYRAIAFDKKQTSPRKRQQLFRLFCNTIKVNPHLRRYIKGICLTGVGLTEDTLTSLKWLQPLSHIDLRGHALTPHDLVMLYQFTKGQCQLIIDNTTLLQLDGRLTLPQGSLNGTEFVSFLNFLHRIHLDNGEQYRNFCDTLTGFDLSQSSVALTIAVRSLYSQRSIYPTAMTQLTVSASQCHELFIDWIESLPQLKHITLTDCKLPQHSQLIDALQSHCETLMIQDNSNSVSTSIKHYTYLITHHSGVNYCDKNLKALKLSDKAVANIKLLSQRHSDALTTAEPIQAYDDHNGATEYKAGDTPHTNVLSNAQQFAAMDFITLAQQHFNKSYKIDAAPLPRDRKRFTLFDRCKHYRKLDHYQDYMHVPVQLQSDCLALFNMTSDEHPQLNALAATVTVLSDPFFSESEHSALHNMQAGMNKTQTLALHKKLSAELANVELAREHYRSKRSSYPMQTRQLQTIALGLKTAVILVKSIEQRLNRPGTTTARLEASDFRDQKPTTLCTAAATVGH